MTIYVYESQPLMSKSIVMLLLRLAPLSKVVELDKLNNLQASVLKNGAPSLFIIDPTKPSLKGTVGITNVQELFPNAPIIAFSSIPAEDAETACLQAGVAIYIEKTRPISYVTDKIKAILKRDQTEGKDEEPSAADKLSFKLSKRQVQLIALIDQGMSNDEIGIHLNISSHTVKVHLWRLYKRFAVKSRTQLLSFARRQHMI